MLCGLALAGLLLAAASTQAASLQVNPILVEFASGEQSQAVWLTNTGEHPLKAQVRIQHWTQDGGEERLTATRDLIASPAILDVPPGEAQLVRIIRPAAHASAAETAYRLIIDELPDDTPREADAGLQFLLRYSIPAFVLPDGVSPIGPTRRNATAPLPAPELDARLEQRGDHSLLHVGNNSRIRVRLSALSWESPDGTRTELAPGLLGYVLAGQRMQWTLPLPATLAGNGGRLRVRFNDDPSDQPLQTGIAGD